MTKKGQGGTAMKTTRPAPVLGILKLEGVQRILLVGAGHGRNARALRERDYQVYAFDPNHGEEVDGWTGVSNQLPEGQRFDLAMTIYVLNVVDRETEADIIETCEHFADDVRHVVRHRELIAELGEGVRGEGLETARGFQRLVECPEGYTLEHSTYKWRLFKNE